MKAKLLAVLLVALVAPWGMVQSAFADWELVNTDSAERSARLDESRGPAPRSSKSEGEFLTLLDRAGLGKKTPVDYRGRIQIRGGFGYWEDDSHGTWNYEELVSNVFGSGRHVFGFTAKHEEYSGEKPENLRYMFDGEGFYVGPSYEYRNFSIDRWGFSGVNAGGTVGYELFTSSGSKLGYFKDEESDVVAGKLYAYFHREGFVKMISLETAFRFDTGSLIARNSWDGDTPGNRTYREAKLRLHTQRVLGDTISLNAGVKASYEADRKYVQVGPAAGFSLWDGIYVDASYQHGTSDDAPEKWDVGVSIDAYKAVPALVRTVRRWFGSEDTGPVENDWHLVH